MFKHKTKQVNVANIGDAPSADSTETKPVVAIKPETEKKTMSLEDIQKLVEKNLKWSQIIYEQNRKINSRLFWISFFGWIKALIIIIPIILAILFLPPIVSGWVERYNSLLGIPPVSTGAINSSATQLDKLLQLLPLDAAQKEQLKAMLK